jgi:outer membrane immunogenic protein
MQRLLYSGLAFGALVIPALVISANAADLAPAPSAGPNWTGLYFGFNGGWGLSSFTVSETPFGVTGIADISPQTAGTNNKGGVFGAQVGYNWQVASWVLGVEGDWDGASITGNQSTVFPSLLGGPGSTDSFTSNEKISSLASLRARLGYTWASSTLFYLTGGGAWESLQTNATISANTAATAFGQSATGNFSNTRSGFVAGGGLEWMATPNWLLRIEYLHYEFRGANANVLGIGSCAASGCGVTVATSNNNIDVFRIAASYKLDWFR